MNIDGLNMVAVDSFPTSWVRGGFPRSYLTSSDTVLVLVASPKHPLAAEKIVHTKDLGGETHHFSRVDCKETN